uniref:Uncharacterized protein n=1 Tax=Spongospora subterranea TaxID=70186 RepID=A0A0H5R5P2_9EUKA|eukprot:CRZ09176.1 hypothetical protein [Spongospora subterranea]
MTSMVEYWTAIGNIDCIHRHQQTSVSPPSIAFTGNFPVDYRSACGALGVLPHPKLVPTRIDDNNDAIQVFGFEFDLGTAAALTLCLPSCRRISTLQFLNAGLTADVIRLLATAIPQSAVVRLHLDWNPISNHDALVGLVGPNSPLQFLNLRGNRLTDGAIQPILSAIADGGQLRVLNLSSNRITSSSCAAIANILRQDRTIISLSLSHNSISDDGLIEILSALVPFPLDPAEAKLAKKFLPRGKLSTGQVGCLGNNVLKNLSCAFAGITDRGVSAAVATLLENTTLARLAFTNNTRISDTIVAELRNHGRICLDSPAPSVFPDDDGLDQAES